MNNRFLSIISNFLLPIIIIVIGCTFSIWMWWFLSQSVQSETRLQFRNDTDQMTGLIQERMNFYTNILYGSQGFFAASEEVTSDEWTSYIKGLNVPQNYSGISTMFFVRHVPAAKLLTFPHSVYPVTTKSDYYPIDYMVQTDPADTNTLGFDESSEVKRNQAITTAAQSGSAVASAVVMGTASYVPEFSIYAPIYANGVPVSSAEERSKALTGFVGAVFRAKALFAGITSDPVFHKNIHFSIYDASSSAESANDTLVFAADDATAKVQDENSLMRSTSVVVGGRTWTIIYSAFPGYGPGLFSKLLPWIVLVGGIFFSLLIGFVVHTLNTLRQQAETLVARATHDLSVSKNDLQDFLDGLSTIVLKVSPDGKVLFANQAAKQMSGLGEGFIGVEYLNGSWFTFDPGTTARAKEYFQAAVAGRMISIEERISVHTTMGQHAITVSLALVPILKDESVQYVIVEARDISAIEKVKEEIQQKNVELERLNKFLVDRELNVINPK